MFQFPGFAPGPLQAGCRAFSAAGCPIRTPADLGPFAPPRGFSQLVTSFIASGSPGIRRPPFSASRMSSAVRATSSCRACARSFLVSYISHGRHPPACPRGMPGGLPHLYPGRLTAPPPVHYVNDLYIARPGMPKHPAGTWRIRESNP